MGTSPQSIVELVSAEVVRKLRLASEADTVEDREIVCEEVFLDVSGILDEAARVSCATLCPSHPACVCLLCACIGRLSYVINGIAFEDPDGMWKHAVCVRGVSPFDDLRAAL